VVGLFDDFGELGTGRVFTGGHVREEIEFGIATHGDEPGKGFVTLLSFGVGGHGEMVATGEDDVASGMLNAGDHGVGSAGLNHGASGVEIGGGDGFDLRPTRRKMLEGVVGKTELGVDRNGLLDNRMVGFGEGDF